MLTFELEVHFDNDDCALVLRPDYVKVEISADDVRKWQRWAEMIKTERLYTVEAWDYRCKFINEVEPGLFEANTEFRQECARVVVDADEVCFSGFEKGGDSRTGWSTVALGLDDLAKQLCE